MKIRIQRCKCGRYFLSDKEECRVCRTHKSKRTFRELCPKCQVSYYNVNSGNGCCASCKRSKKVRKECCVCELPVIPPISESIVCRNCTKILGVVVQEKEVGLALSKLKLLARFEKHSEELQKSDGTLAGAGRVLGVSRERVRQMIERFPELGKFLPRIKIAEKKQLKQEALLTERTSKQEAREVKKKNQKSKEEERILHILSYAKEHNLSISVAWKTLGYTSTRLVSKAREHAGLKPHQRSTRKVFEKRVQHCVKKLQEGLSFSASVKDLKLTHSQKQSLYQHIYANEELRELIRTNPKTLKEFNVQEVIRYCQANSCGIYTALKEMHHSGRWYEIVKASFENYAEWKEIRRMR